MLSSLCSKKGGQLRRPRFRSRHVAGSDATSIRLPLACLHYCGGYMGAVGELEDLGGVVWVGGVMLCDAPDVRVQIVVTLVKQPSLCIRAGLQQAGMRGETGGQGWVRREGQLLARPLSVQVLLREAVLAVVVRGLYPKAVVPRRDLEPGRLHNALGGGDLGWTAGLPFGRNRGFSDAAQGRELIGRYGFLTFSA